VFADGSGGPDYKRGRRVGDRERKIFSEKLWGSHFVVLIREMDARAALSERGGLGVFVRGVTNKNDRRMTTLALDLFLEMRAVCPGMLALAGVCTWAALMGAGMLLIIACIKGTY
jgi:hypothetical protein